jgi:drug/metabolite transporter (DMT)-like permease
LLLVALIWGSTFVLVKRTVVQYPVYAFLFLRFALATGVLLVLFGRRLARLSPSMLLAGAAIGLFLFGGYAFQTVGLQYTSASKAGFITGLSVVFVPMLSMVFLRRMPEPQALLGVVLATVGLALLTLGRDLRPAQGDLIVLGCAVCYALHIVAVSRFAPRTDALALTVVQVAVVALLSGAVSLAAGEWPRAIPAPVLLAAAFTGVLATALAFAVQNAVQTRTTATHTALIFTTEPVFAALFGFLLAGERLGVWGWGGCGLILLGMLLAELRPPIGLSLVHGWKRAASLAAQPAATANLASQRSIHNLQEEEEKRS